MGTGTLIAIATDVVAVVNHAAHGVDWGTVEVIVTIVGLLAMLCAVVMCDGWAPNDAMA